MVAPLYNCTCKQEYTVCIKIKVVKGYYILVNIRSDVLPIFVFQINQTEDLELRRKIRRRQKNIREKRHGKMFVVNFRFHVDY